MAEEQYKALTHEELNELAGEELPERAAMSLINANVAAPVNAAVAANVLSDNSVAFANAQQTADTARANWGDPTASAASPAGGVARSLTGGPSLRTRALTWPSTPSPA